MAEELTSTFKKILILGATGRTGKHVVELALQQGYLLSCVVRGSQKIKSNGTVSVVEGSPEKLSDLERAIRGCDAVISVLNVSRISDFPWAKLRTPPSYMSDVMKHVIQLAEKHNIKRIIVCSAWGASETKQDIPVWFRWFIDHSNIGYAYRDHERQEALLKKSNLEWTIVRPTGLTNSKKLQQVIVSYDNKPSPRMTISRRTVAKFLVEALSDKTLIHKTPVISGV